jgi:uncharacterized protein DUF3179
VWKSAVEGRTLRFRLSGINNQNFIMADEATGTWWQQVSGEALHGPLAGKALEPMPWEEVTFAVLKQEHPEARVLLGVDEFRDEYASADWEKEIAALPTVTEADPCRRMEPRDLVVGVTSDAMSKAYPWAELTSRHLIQDTLGGTPLLLLLHPDGRSLRCFDRRLADDEVEISLVPSCPPVLRDRKTGSVWDFGGVAVSGPLEGRRLRRHPCLKDYWFDWSLYNPASLIFSPAGSD